MRFTLQGKQILHDGRPLDEYPSKGDAMAVFNMLGAAYNEGMSKGLLDAEDKFFRAKYKSESSFNFRWVLHIALVLSLIGLVLVFTTLSAGWTLIALVASFTAGAVLYGLGRIERVTF